MTGGGAAVNAACSTPWGTTWIRASSIDGAKRTRSSRAAVLGTITPGAALTVVNSARRQRSSMCGAVSG